jgi:hypothetical protein
MGRFYVNIEGVSQAALDFLGYIVIFENNEFKILSHKGDVHVVDKSKPYLYVDDKNDQELLSGPFKARERITLPPKLGH